MEHSSLDGIYHTVAWLWSAWRTCELPFHSFHSSYPHLRHHTSAHAHANSVRLCLTAPTSSNPMISRDCHLARFSYWLWAARSGVVRLHEEGALRTTVTSFTSRTLKLCNFTGRPSPPRFCAHTTPSSSTQTPNRKSSTHSCEHCYARFVRRLTSALLPASYTPHS